MEKFSQPADENGHVLPGYWAINYFIIVIILAPSFLKPNK